MITGNIVDNVAPDAFNRLPALLLKPLELNVFLDLQLVNLRLGRCDATGVFRGKNHAIFEPVVNIFLQVFPEFDFGQVDTGFVLRGGFGHILVEIHVVFRKFVPHMNHGVTLVATAHIQQHMGKLLDIGTQI